MLAALREQVRPVVGEVEVARVTAPVNPLTRASVIVDVPETLSLTITIIGLADTMKSCTW